MLILIIHSFLILLNTIMQYAVMLNFVILSVIILSANKLCAIKLSVVMILTIVVMLSSAKLIVVMRSVIILSYVRLIATMLSIIILIRNAEHYCAKWLYCNISLQHCKIIVKKVLRIETYSTKIQNNFFSRFFTPEIYRKILWMFMPFAFLRWKIFFPKICHFVT